MAWNPIDQPVNKFQLSNAWSPGVCVVEGASVARAIDERRGYGIDYAFVVFFGRKLAHFKTNILLWKPDQFDEFEEKFQPLIEAVPRRGAVNTANGTGYDPACAATIWHPQLSRLRITSCMVENEPQLTPSGTKGVWLYPIEFCQIVTKPRAAYAKTEAAKDSPLDPLDQRIHDLTQQLLEPSQAQSMAPRAPGAPR